MPDDLRDVLRRESDVPVPEPDVASVLREGRQRKIRRTLAVTASSAALLIGLFFAASFALELRRDTVPARPPQATLAAVGSEQDQAEAFAVHAVASAGLVDIQGTFYAFEGSERDESQWKVSFSRTVCVTGELETCFPAAEVPEDLSTWDPEQERDFRVDAWLDVALDDDVWRVVGLEGNWDADVEEHLVGYAERLVDGEPGWEVASHVLEPPNEDQRRGQALRAGMLWVGPIPHEDGTTCTVVAHDSSGRTIDRSMSFYGQGPAPGRGRAGTVRGMRLPPDVRADSVSFDCESASSRPEDDSRSAKISRFFVTRFMERRIAGSGAEGFLDADGRAVFGAERSLGPLYPEPQLQDFDIVFVDEVGDGTFEVGVRLIFERGSYGQTYFVHQPNGRLVISGGRSGLEEP